MASTARRRRELARARWKRQQQRRTTETRRRGRLAKILGVLVAVVAVAGGVVLVAGALDNDEPSADSAASRVCEYRATDDGVVPDLGLPAASADAAAPTAATLTIGESPVEIELFSDEAPCAAHSFAFLGAADYFDASPCHRLTTSDTLKVLQCGDPTGIGGGGPGYEFDNENTDGATYPAGTLAMANGGVDTNGSQFFLVYADSQLDPDYTVFGRVTSGLDVLTGIAEQGTADGGPDGAPKTPVTLTDVITS